MLTHSICQKYARPVLEASWARFCDEFSITNATQPITIKTLADGTNEWNCVIHLPFQAIRYQENHPGAPLIIVAGDIGATYGHIVNSPKEIDVFYEPSGHIFAVVITDIEKSKTAIYFEDDAVVVEESPPKLRALFVDCPASSFSV